MDLREKKNLQIVVASVEMDYRTSNYAIHSVLNEYTYADPTLPRVDNIDCPNKDCESQSHPEKEKLRILNMIKQI